MMFGSRVRTSSGRKAWASPTRCFSSRKRGSGRQPIVSEPFLPFLSLPVLPPHPAITSCSPLSCFSFLPYLICFCPHLICFLLNATCTAYSTFAMISFQFPKMRELRSHQSGSLASVKYFCVLFAVTNMTHCFLSHKFVRNIRSETACFKSNTNAVGPGKL